MRYTDGRAWIEKCPKGHCEAPVIEAHVDGLITRLSVKSVPFKDAAIFSKYGRTIVNVWVGPTQLWANVWFHTLGEPLKGRLYLPHICGTTRP